MTDDQPLPTRLLELQAIDTEADQLRVRRERSPLRDDLAAKSEQLAQWERRRTQLSGRIAELAATIETEEREGADLATHKERLERQLKTVIAPREAEALMHEITTIDEQRDALDLKEIEALEEQSELDDELSVHLRSEQSVADAARLADAALAESVADIDAELAALAERGAAIRATLSDAILANYDRKRAALGVAVAPLVGRQCQGCHLDLSAAEIDTVRDEAADTGVTDCPQCGRLLIV